jgi:hypothetical protein
MADTEIYTVGSTDQDAVILGFAADTQTVNFASTDTAAEIQALIDAVPKYIPYGKTVTFQFGDGTYSLTDSLNFDGFYGGGRVNIWGNTSDSTSKSTSQSVYLDFSASNGISVQGNRVSFIEVKHFRIDTPDGNSCIYMTKNAGYVRVLYGYYTNDGKTSTSSNGVFVTQYGKVYIQANYFNNNYYAIQANDMADLVSFDNDDTGTSPTYGLRAITNSTIGKISTQPTGSTADELSQNGSAIR